MRNSEEESIFDKALRAYLSLSVAGSKVDTEFDILEAFVNSNINKGRYSQAIIDIAVDAVVKLDVTEKSERAMN
jgi:hypothetical protein